MGVAHQNRVKMLNRAQIDAQIHETPRSKHDLIEERKEHAEKQAALRHEIAALRDDLARQFLEIESLELDVRAEKARGDSWKARCKAALKSADMFRGNWQRASELLRLAGTEAVNRLRELRDMHVGQ